jgi:predicted TIM-barrel fold metal-dependent hydrolase
MHRLDDDFAFLKNGFSTLKEKPSEYVKRNVWVTCEADERPMTRVLEEFPASHIMMATDYPHFDSEFPNTVKGIRDRSDLTDRQKDMILGENAAALLGL